MRGLMTLCCDFIVPGTERFFYLDIFLYRKTIKESRVGWHSNLVPSFRQQLILMALGTAV